jgi:AcrR family transcriptional regulator
VPRVARAHLEARRRQILAAARACFARDGFHRATMHDVVRAAGLSAGAVYRYFPGKEAIVETLAHERHRREREAIAGAGREESALGALRALARAFVGALAEPAEAEERRLGIQIWAEALREPRLRRIVREGVDAPRRRLATLLRRAKRRGELPPDLDADATARLAIAVFHGIVLQKAWDPALDLEAVLAQLDRGLPPFVPATRRRAQRRSPALAGRGRL